MQARKQFQAEQKAEPATVVSRWDAFFNDLGLLVSVGIAWLIVRRTLRRRGRERAARLKRFRLIHGGDNRVDRRVITS